MYLRKVSALQFFDNHIIKKTSFSGSLLELDPISSGTCYKGVDRIVFSGLLTRCVVSLTSVRFYILLKITSLLLWKRTLGLFSPADHPSPTNWAYCKAKHLSLNLKSDLSWNTSTYENLNGCFSLRIDPGHQCGTEQSNGKILWGGGKNLFLKVGTWVKVKVLCSWDVWVPQALFPWGLQCAEWLRVDKATGDHRVLIDRNPNVMKLPSKV